MKQTKEFSKRSMMSLIALIVAGETIFFLPFVLARIFRPTLLAVFEISNTELGLYFSIYGIVAMVSYFFGGPLADRFPARNLMSTALWLTGFGGFIMAFFPFKGIMFYLYGFWGLTTILLFWAALIRATREWGASDYQGRAFGWLEGGRGLTAAILGTLTLVIFSSFSDDALPSTDVSQERIDAFQRVVFFISFFTVFIGVLVWYLVPNNRESRYEEYIKPQQIIFLLKKPSIWLLAIIIVCAYVGYKITDDFSLYANEVLGFSEFKSAGIGTSALWMRAMVAIIAGYFADKVSASGMIKFSFAFTIVGSALIASGLLEQVILLVMLNLVVVMVGVYGVRALYFALIQEASIPIYYTGTAAGIVSVLGYTPDVFMSPWMGTILDHNPGVLGHRMVFLVLTIFSVIGFIAVLLFRKLESKEVEKYTNG